MSVRRSHQVRQMRQAFSRFCDTRAGSSFTVLYREHKGGKWIYQAEHISNDRPAGEYNEKEAVELLRALSFSKRVVLELEADQFYPTSAVAKLADRPVGAFARTRFIATRLHHGIGSTFCLVDGIDTTHNPKIVEHLKRIAELDQINQSASYSNFIDFTDSSIDGDPTALFSDKQRIKSLCDLFGCDEMYVWTRDPDRDYFRRTVPDSAIPIDFVSRDKLILHCREKRRYWDICLRGRIDQTILPPRIRQRAKAEDWNSVYVEGVFLRNQLIGLILVAFSSPRPPHNLTKFGLHSCARIVEYIQNSSFITSEIENEVSKLRGIQQLIYAGMISYLKVHDTNGVLGNINIGIDRRIKSLVDDEQVEFLRRTKAEIESSIEDCETVMKFANFDKFQDEIVALKGIVDDAAKLFKRDIDDFEISIANEIDESVRLLGDKDALTQVFVNLFSNAIYFFKNTKDLKDPAITITSRVDSEAPELVGIFFSDNGPGIGGPSPEWVFEFLKSGKKAGDGTGIGLSVSRLIVEHHGGSIAVLQHRNAGVTFKLRLPFFGV